MLTKFFFIDPYCDKSAETDLKKWIINFADFSYDFKLSLNGFCNLHWEFSLSWKIHLSDRLTYEDFSKKNSRVEFSWTTFFHFLLFSSYHVMRIIWCSIAVVKFIIYEDLSKNFCVEFLRTTFFHHRSLIFE